MTIFELAELIDADLVVTKTDENGYYAKFEHGELTDGSILMSECGRGRSPNGAIREYIQKIRGQRLVIDAYKETRREFVIPVTLVYKPWTRRESTPFMKARSV
ncbi:MAG: hypothetical protein G01um10143_772 [Parcubacteria group bacterium Gr01-1014_3]|nr:MAG: hypothetical protein G01um10143_772 [Parcubacteria group bacterium Gr01-1014_3]